MSDHDPSQDPSQDPKKTLSEISHLFLSSIRDKQTNGAPRPQRKAPGQPPADAKPQPQPPRTDISIDLTPEEFARMYGGGADDGPAAAHEAEAAEPAPRKIAPVAAVIASHLNGKQFDRVKEYARHLAGQVGRIGLIELDASEFRLMCFEPGATPGDLADAAAATAQTVESYDPRQIAEAIEELNWDVQRWVVLLTTPRVPEARALLRQIDHWVLLTTCDHDGVVSSYRTLKGLLEPSHEPRVTLALLDGESEPEMVAVYRKLSSVCRQFLDVQLDPEPAVRRSFRIAEHLVLLCRPTRDKAQMANPPQWAIVSEFLAAAKASAAIESEANAVTPDGEDEGVEMNVEMPEQDAPIQAHGAAQMRIPAGPTLGQHPFAPAPAAQHAPVFAPTRDAPSARGYDEVIELPDSGASADAILGAVLRQNNGNFIECPVRAPMCDDIRLAVSRDRGIVIFAVAREGLGELRSIGQAYKWVRENRTLLGMALPQFAIDPNQSPRLRLLVDQSDLAADALQPVLQSDNVTVQSYRKLKWGGRTGLLLEAA